MSEVSVDIKISIIRLYVIDSYDRASFCNAFIFLCRLIAMPSFATSRFHSSQTSEI